MLTGMQLENIAQQATQRVEKLTTLQGDLTTFTTVYAQTDPPPFHHCASYTWDTFCDSLACLMLYSHLMILAFLSMAEMPYGTRSLALSSFLRSLLLS